MSKSLIGKLLVKVRTLNKGYVQVLHQDKLGLHAGTHFDHAACSYSVTQARHAFYLGAMLAAEEGAFLFESVTDNMNPAIPAGRGQRMDCTLEAVERVGCAIHGHLECLVVVVSAGFASSHDGLSSILGKGVHTITRSGPRRFRRAPVTRKVAKMLACSFMLRVFTAACPAYFAEERGTWAFD
jgi:hypothetical protein